MAAAAAEVDDAAAFEFARDIGDLPEIVALRMDRARHIVGGGRAELFGVEGFLRTTGGG